MLDAALIFGIVCWYIIGARISYRIIRRNHRGTLDETVAALLWPIFMPILGVCIVLNWLITWRNE